MVITIVVAMHAFLPYLSSAVPTAFDKYPYLWRAFPLVDARRWLGFDIFCAWQDIYLMALLFFLSGLFTWPNLARRGTAGFLRRRVLRLGVPYLFGTLVLMPLSLYPVYRAREADPSLGAFFDHLFALPFWDNGPMWFLWQLLVLTFIAAALYRFAPRWIEFLGARSSNSSANPARYFLGLTAAATLAYVPLALAFTPMAWSNQGPLTMQLSRPLMYAVFYVAGLGIGARGFDRGLLATDGALAQGWRGWLAVASFSFAMWLGLTGLSVMTHSSSIGLQVAIGVVFAIAAVSGCLAALAISLRFANSYSRTLDSLSQNGLGLYLVHFPIAVWLQFALLDLAAFALAKAMIVFGLTMLFSLAIVIALRRVPLVGARLVGEPPQDFRYPLPRRVFSVSRQFQ